jgi:hypothetical protein
VGEGLEEELLRRREEVAEEDDGGGGVLSPIAAALANPCAIALVELIVRRPLQDFRLAVLRLPVTAVQMPLATGSPLCPMTPFLETPPAAETKSIAPRPLQNPLVSTNTDFSRAENAADHASPFSSPVATRPH